jgi:hypothetical protein
LKCVATIASRITRCGFHRNQRSTPAPQDMFFSKLCCPELRFAQASALKQPRTWISSQCAWHHVSRVGNGRPAGSIELRVSPSPSRIPYGGFSPVRLQMDRQWRPSTTSHGLSAVHIRPMIPSPIYSVGLCSRAASLTPEEPSANHNARQ